MNPKRVREKERETMGNEYREGWERTFGPKPAPRMLRCLHTLRRGMRIEVTLPEDLRLSDIRRFVWYLATMCDDWDVNDGMPEIVLPSRRGPALVKASGTQGLREKDSERSGLWTNERS